MRLLVITYRLPVELCTGDQYTIHHMLKHFSKRHEIVLLTFASSEAMAHRQELVAPYCRDVEVVRMSRWQSYRNCLKGLISSDPLQVSYFQSSEMAARVRRAVRRHKIDVAYAYHMRSGQYLSGEDSCPCVLDLKPVQTLNLQRMKAHVSNPFRKSLYASEYRRVRHYEPSLARRFQRCLVISETDRRAVDPENVMNNVVLNPHGLDPDYFAPDPSCPKEPGSMVFSGNMNYDPNADAAVYFCRDIYPRIKTRVPSAKLYIVGKNPQARVRALASDPSVVVTGFVKDIRPYLSRAQVAIDPLRIGAGLQNKVLEAMSMGLPMVMTSVANEGILAEHGRHVHIADAAGEFAKHVVDLLNDPRQRQVVGQRARDFVALDWSWEKHFTELEEMFVTLVNERRRVDEYPADSLASPRRPVSLSANRNALSSAR